jgi:hypothetical protein
MTTRIGPSCPPVATRPTSPDWVAQQEREQAIALAVASRRALTCSLFDLPEVPATDEKLLVVRSCHTLGLALGLVLPEYPATRMVFVEDRASCRGGETQGSVPGQPIVMAFSSGLSLAVDLSRFTLRHVALHELKHVDQFATGRMAALSADEREAEAFAWGAMRGRLTPVGAG